MPMKATCPRYGGLLLEFDYSPRPRSDPKNDKHGARLVNATPHYHELDHILNRFYPDNAAIIHEIDSAFAKSGRKFKPERLRLVDSAPSKTTLTPPKRLRLP